MTFRDADCGTGYFLGRLKMKLKKIEKKRQKQIELFDIHKLDELRVCEDYENDDIE